MNRNRKFPTLLRLLSGLVLAAVSTLALAASPEADREKIRNQSQQVLAKLYEAQPSAKIAIANSSGYATFSKWGLTLGPVGAGIGRGQSSQLQGSDKAACQSWAQKESGFDPATPPPAKPQVAKARGGMLRGAVVGAAAGELINDDAGKGAAVGATAGGVRQGVRNHGAQASVDADYQAKLATYQNGQAAFSKAYGACMEGRGYTVK